MQPSDLTILQVSPSDIGGGAEAIAAGLHQAYLDRGADAWLALGADHKTLPRTLQVPNTENRSAWARAVLGAAGLADPAANPRLPHIAQRAARLLAEPGRYLRVWRGHEDFDSPGSAHLLELTPRVPDVLQLHNLHGAYFDIRALKALSARVPTVVTLHDTWLLTGHCAHPIDCRGWLDGCGGCPAKDRYVPIRRDASADNFRVKLEALEGRHVRAATPSRWLAGMVANSPMGERLAEVRVIPNGIDTGVFTPGDKWEARAALDLPAEAFVIAFAARGGVSSDFKGFSTLAASLPEIARTLRDLNVILVAVGETPTPGTAAIDADPPIRYLEFQPDPHAMAQLYRAADLYLHPALAESFGLTILEAMACGTPVVASDVGGIPEVVANGETGILVPAGDPAALAAAVARLARDPQRRSAFASAGIARAATFTLDRQADAYLEWFLELVSSHAASSSDDRS